jgi:hypothetical protein
LSFTKDLIIQESTLDAKPELDNALNALMQDYGASKVDLFIKEMFDDEEPEVTVDDDIEVVAE